MYVYPYYSEETASYQPHEFHELRKRYIGLICPECKKSSVIEFDYNVTVGYLSNNKPKGHYIIDVFPTITYTCPHCNKDVVTDVLLDPNIVHILEKLNNKGWETDCSCEGHIVMNDEVTYSSPYITFKHYNIKKVLEYIPLQGGWKYILYDKRMFCIYWDDDLCAKFENTNRDWMYSVSTRMLYLDRWVECLPTIKNHKFTPNLITDEIKNKMEAHNFGHPLDDKELSTVHYIYEK